MGNRGPLPLESPDWIPINEAFEQRRRHASADLAIYDLEQVLRSGRLRSMVRYRKSGGPIQNVRLRTVFWADCKIVRWLDGIRVLPPPRCVFGGSWWFFVWKPDMKNIFAPDEPAQPSAPRPQEKPANTGKLFKRDWIDVALRASALARHYPNDKPHGIVIKLMGELLDEGLKVPAKSDLQKIVDQAFEFKKSRK